MGFRHGAYVRRPFARAHWQRSSAQAQPETRLIGSNYIESDRMLSNESLLSSESNPIESESNLIESGLNLQCCIESHRILYNAI